MNRREFNKATLAAGALGTVAAGTAQAAQHETANSPMSKSPFKLKYAPHFGMGKEHVGRGNFEDELQFFYDNGFRALEDNRMMLRPLDEQKRISKKLDQLGMEMGVFVAFGIGAFGSRALSGNVLDIQLVEENGVVSTRTVSPAPRRNERDQEGVRAMLKAHCERAIETAKRCNAKWMTVVPGAIDASLDREYQLLNVVDHLKYMAGMFEPHGLVMVLEPLNFYNHPNLFLERVQDAYVVCKMVNSPSCKILNDLYHQQISVGNLIPNMLDCWDETPYFQVGDNPGRKEPTTGEINYKNIFKVMHEKGFTGIVGMEHGIMEKGKAGEIRLIEAYREVDDFS